MFFPEDLSPGQLDSLFRSDLLLGLSGKARGNPYGLIPDSGSDSI